MSDPLRKYRKQFRLWLNKRRLEKEGAYYRKQFVNTTLSVPDEQVTVEHFKKMFPYLEGKPKGELSILAIFHDYNWEKDALLPPLECFGKVRHYDWGSEFDHLAEDWHKKNKKIMNDALISRVSGWVRRDDTDVIFCYLSGQIVYPETIQKIKNFGVPLVNLALNDKESFVGKSTNGQAMGVRDICRHFHLCWTSTEDALEKYCVEGAMPIYLPEGGNPIIHKPYPEKRDIAVSFIGQCYENRPIIIQQLKEMGINVETYGYGWPNGPLSTKDMVRMYSKSKVNLGFGGVAGLNHTFCLKGRDFEVPMSGGLYLTEYHSELERWFLLDDELVTYSNVKELARKIRFLLSHPDEAERIRIRGYERALKEHTWEKRFEKIFTLIGVLIDV